MKEAMFYKIYDKDKKTVQCHLCKRNCIIKENERGFCGVRENKKGKLYSLVFGKAVSIAIDPIEKKPFFHFAPSSRSLSIATVGCNFRCLHCQNYEISQPSEIFGENVPPEKVVKIARERNVQGMSWTYTEPTVFYEYFYETAKICRSDFYQTWVTNGFTGDEAIKKAVKFLDAVNVDYKGNDEFYRNICSAWLEPVREALVLYKKYGVWIEITNLVIPGYNDKEEIIKEMCNWIVENLGNEVPLHFSMYFPYYKLQAQPTPFSTLEKAYNIAKKIGLDYVYIGNVRSDKENTYCPNCNELLIQRHGYFVEKIDLGKKGKGYCCPNCGHKIPIAGMKWVNFNA